MENLNNPIEVLIEDSLSKIAKGILEAKFNQKLVENKNVTIVLYPGGKEEEIMKLVNYVANKE